MSKRGKVERAALGIFGIFMIAFGLFGMITLWYPWLGYVSVITGLILVLEATDSSVHRRKRDWVNKKVIGKGIVYLALLLISLGMLIMVDLPIHSRGILSLLILFSIWGVYYYTRKGHDIPED
ncbi:MAG: hypothetical protein LN417_07645 [Candidatus Thermoplasmatota archaeon]|nr:hypothetical protein [Candidatus Thermoplasmatota archaeon]